MLGRLTRLSLRLRMTSLHKFRCDSRIVHPLGFLRDVALFKIEHDIRNSYYDMLVNSRFLSFQSLQK